MDPRVLLEAGCNWYETPCKERLCPKGERAEIRPGVTILNPVAAGEGEGFVQPEVALKN